MENITKKTRYYTNLSHIENNLIKYGQIPITILLLILITWLSIMDQHINMTVLETFTFISIVIGASSIVIGIAMDSEQYYLTNWWFFHHEKNPVELLNTLNHVNPIQDQLIIKILNQHLK